MRFASDIPSGAVKTGGSEAGALGFHPLPVRSPEFNSKFVLAPSNSAMRPPLTLAQRSSFGSAMQ